MFIIFIFSVGKTLVFLLNRLTNNYYNGKAINALLQNIFDDDTNQNV